MKNEEQSNWQYSPEGDDESADPGLAAAVNNELKKPARAAAQKPLSWTASEYIDHKQGPGWFAALALATVVIAGLTYLLTKEYFTSGVVIMLGIIIGLFAKRQPRRLTYELSDQGLSIAGKAYPYSLFRSFSILQDGALLSLNLAPIKRFMPPISAYFDVADQEKIVGFLENNLPYEENKLDFVEKLTRRLRF